jgi:flagellar basal body-associated protein FliL
MTESPAKPPKTMSDNQILIALVTLVEMLILGGIAVGYFMTKADTWIHVGVGVLVIAGAAVMYLSWKDTQAKKGGNNA